VQVGEEVLELPLRFPGIRVSKGSEISDRADALLPGEVLDGYLVLDRPPARLFRNG
jgi:hypothetical protein